MKNKFFFGLLVIILSMSFQIGLVVSASGSNTTEGDIFARALQLQQNNKEAEALSLYERILLEEPNHYRALFNAAFLHLRQGWLYSSSTQEKKQHYLKLLDYSGRAATIKPGEYQAKLLNIVAMGKTAGYFSTGDQVRIVREMKQELDELIKTHGDDPDLIYVLSWLNFKVGRVSSVRKFFASVFLGGLPQDLTIEKALFLMHKAIALRPDYAIYYYDLGLFHQRLGQLSQARPLFEKVLSISVTEPEEAIYQKRAVNHLQEIDEQKLAKD